MAKVSWFRRPRWCKKCHGRGYIVKSRPSARPDKAGMLIDTVIYKPTVCNDCGGSGVQP